MFELDFYLHINYMFVGLISLLKSLLSLYSIKYLK